ncbi:MAG: helix-turn-helix domain-containing protein, partial [Desulfovibrionaceae bacterium]
AGRAAAAAARRGADPDCGRLPHFRPGVIHDPALAAAVARAHDALSRPETPRLARQELLAGLLERWVAGWAEASSIGPAREPAADPVGVARAREYLHQAFPGDPGLPELARVASLSPYHLTRAFTRALGLPPHAYLTQLRLDRARELIRAGRPIADAALEAGFADQSHLTRCFKRRFGVAPGAWRKNVQES